MAGITLPAVTGQVSPAFDSRRLAALTMLVEHAHGAAPCELAGVVHDAAAHLGARSVQMLLVDFAREILTPLPAFPGAPVSPAIPVNNDSLAGQAFLLGSPVAAPAKDGAVIACPLLNGVERLGALVLHLDDGGEEMQSVCRWFADMVTQFISSKGRYTDEFHLVRQSQPMSLPAQLQWQAVPPVTAHAPQAAVAAQVEPAYDVGGDAYDYAFNSDRLHLAIFDAMGHGIAAGVTTALVLGCYRHSRRLRLSLPEIVSRCDAVLGEQFPDERFVTALLAELELATGRLTLVNAGSPHPMLLRHGRVLTLPVEPVPPLGLGLHEGRTAAVAETILQADDLLMFATDGVFDARDAQGLPFAESGLIQAAERLARHRLPLDGLVRLITHQVREHQHGKLRDDASLLIAEYFGATEVRPPADITPRVHDRPHRS